MKNGLLPALAVALMLLWPCLDSELLQDATAWIVLVIAIVLTFRAATNRKRTLATALPVIFAAAFAFALTARHQVAKASDAYAAGLIKRHPCRPTFADLSVADERWERGRGPMLLELRKFGAVRVISYQENGLLRFGFPHDDSRSVWLPECAAMRPDMAPSRPPRL